MKNIPQPGWYELLLIRINNGLLRTNFRNEQLFKTEQPFGIEYNPVFNGKYNFRM